MLVFSSEGTRTDALTSSVACWSSGQLTPKRRHRGAGFDGWYPYYAGFSSAFAAAALGEFCLAKDAVVLDPWNGSGTTTCVAMRAGYTSIGVDLNPCMSVVARAKLASLGEAQRLPDDVSAHLELVSKVHEQCDVSQDALCNWLPLEAARYARSFIDLLANTSTSRSAAPAALTGRRRALMALTVLHAVRELGVDQTKSNRSWLLPHANLEATSFELQRSILRHARRISEDAELCSMDKRPRTRIVQGDARKLGVPDSSVDFVLTSPPYCTRVDYARQTSVELACLFGMQGAQIRTLRDSLMGTTTIRSERSVRALGTSVMSERVEATLTAIAEHESHRSAAYYARNFRQYFEDAARAVDQIRRVLRHKGRAVLVLQNSFYKEIEIPLSSLYVDMAKDAGLTASVVAQVPVSRSMTTLNTAARKNGTKHTYSEDIVLMEKR